MTKQPQAMKVCTECGESFPKEQFPFKDRSRLIVGSVCFKCCKKRWGKIEPTESTASPLDIVEGQFASWAADQDLWFTEANWELLCKMIRKARYDFLTR
jgi:hypothetical protein